MCFVQLLPLMQMYLNKGELMEIVEKDFPKYLNSTLYKILTDLFQLKVKFLKLAIDPEAKIIDDSYFIKQLSLSSNEKIILSK